jgi:hypothetical protein
VLKTLRATRFAVQRVFKDKPPRLDLVFQRSNAPLYFVTFNTHARESLLAKPEVHEAFIEYCRRAANFRIGVGRYVLMPDHIHLFVCFGVGCSITLSRWIKGLKRELDRVLLSIGRKPATRPVKNSLPSGNRAFTIICCAATRATPRSGTMCSRILCALGLLLVLKNGRMRVRSCELIARDEYDCSVRCPQRSFLSALRTAHTTTPCAEDSARYSTLSQLTALALQRK